MTRTDQTKTDRALSEQELNVVTGGAVKQPNNSTILINRPTFPGPHKPNTQL